LGGGGGRQRGGNGERLEVGRMKVRRRTMENVSVYLLVGIVVLFLEVVLLLLLF
jgi:hypothetical protein